MDPTQTFTAGQVEDLTGLSSETLRVWRRRGFIPRTRAVGGRGTPSAPSF
ncbi:hypothetical protein TSH58p_03465 [Azospirillum sp. TSH58]|nr:hypothetical protein TSH58p_03465 [Azospirillum sp. TSH58]